MDMVMTYVDSAAAFLPEMPTFDISAIDFSSYADLSYVQTLVEATYMSGAGLLLDSGFFLEYGYALAAIAVALVFISVTWFLLRKQIVTMVDMKLPSMGITYTAAELAAKFNAKMGLKKPDEKEVMKMKAAPVMKAEPAMSMKAAPAMVKKSPMKTMKKSPARGKTPTPSKTTTMKKSPMKK
jgi:hypothetical protein